MLIEDIIIETLIEDVKIEILIEDVNRCIDRVKLCASHQDRVLDSKAFYKQAHLQGLSSVALHHIKLIADNPSKRMRSVANHSVASHRSRSNRNTNTFWLVLPFVPATFATGIASRITSYFKAPWVQIALRLAFGQEVRVRGDL